MRQGTEEPNHCSIHTEPRVCCPSLQSCSNSWNIHNAALRCFGPTCSLLHASNQIKSNPDLHLSSFTELVSLASDSLRSNIDFSIA